MLLHGQYPRRPGDGAKNNSTSVAIGKSFPARGSGADVAFRVAAADGKAAVPRNPRSHWVAGGPFGRAAAGGRLGTQLALHAGRD